MGIKVAVNHFHLLRSFDRKESAQFMSRPFQICTRGWHLTNVDYFTRSDYWKWNSILLIVSYKTIHLKYSYHLIWCCLIRFSLKPNFPSRLRLLNHFIRLKLNQFIIIKHNYFYLSDLFSDFLQQLLDLDAIDLNSLHNQR
jgi:hypothetical protein